MLIKNASSIYLSVFLSVGATLGGWAITGKFAGSIAAESFLYLSVPMVVGLVALQILLFIKSKSQLKYLILFNMSAASGVLWMMSCLVLPIFWIDSVGVSGKVLMVVLSSLLFYFNVVEGINKFRLRWGVVGESLLKKYYKSDRGLIDWNGIIGALKISASFHIPGISQNIQPILSAALVISMLAGFSLRKIFPVFSIFAWSVPSLFFIAMMLQVIGVAIGQISMLKALEKNDGKIIRLYND